MSQRRRPSPNGGPGEVLVRFDRASTPRGPLGRSGFVPRAVEATGGPAPIRLTLRRWMIVAAAVAGVAAFAVENRSRQSRTADYWERNARLRQDLVSNLAEQSRVKEILRKVPKPAAPDVVENVERARDDLRRRENAIRLEMFGLRPW